MSSILTNNSATVALNTLKSITAQIGIAQNEISTGKKVAQPGNNSAVWAISKAMEADVAGFKKISDSLTLGQSTLAVGRQGAETITELLTEVKGLVVTAQGENVDRSKIQADIKSYQNQIESIVQAANFNGTTMLQNTDSTAGTGDIKVLASLDRSQSDVTTSELTIRKRDLSTQAQSIAAAGGTYTEDEATGTLNATQSVTLDLSAVTVETGAAYSISIFGTDADDSTFVQDDLRTTAGSSEDQAEMASGPMSYVARDGDTMSDILSALQTKFKTYTAANDISSDTLSMSYSGTNLTFTSGATNATDTIGVAFNSLLADAGNTIGGGLGDLDAMDVTTTDGAKNALASIEGLIDISIKAASAFGSDERRMDTQKDFINKISDSLKAGIGSLTDTDLEETSARLQALQVQQQLAQQALSIANAAPQTLLGLFR